MNKFSKYFSDGMTSEQARTRYFSFLGKVTDDEEIKELFEAYKEYDKKVFKKELEDAYKNDIIF